MSERLFVCLHRQRNKTSRLLSNAVGLSVSKNGIQLIDTIHHLGDQSSTDYDWHGGLIECFTIHLLKRELTIVAQKT
ncbi:hypothetical protein J6590_067079 [Homalodisca vitripennis]|nr:hypothetical protein J6590_067079 [Homalodisca vitripennis]